MHRLPKAARLSAVMLSLLVVSPVSAVADARSPDGRPPAPPVRTWTPDADVLARTAPQAVKHNTTTQRCTGWRSTLRPPPTIRVLRTKGPASGTVQEIDFRTYVLTVFGGEWQGLYPIEALKAGSVAVKQYGWYYTIVYRGGVDSVGNCYDVQDNTNDQYYQPELRTPTQAHVDALATTWDVTLRKYTASTRESRFFLTGYRTGSSDVCAADVDHFRLYEQSVFDCAKRRHYTWKQILRTYLNPRLEFVVPGEHNIIGNGLGDTAALVRVDPDVLTPRIYAPSTPGNLTAAASSAIAVDPTGLRGAVSVDLTNDGFDDLLTFTSTGDTTLQLSVAVSDGAADYRTPVVWWHGDVGITTAGARLLAADFNGDGRRDAGVILQDPAGTGDPPPPAVARLLMFKGNQAMAAFVAPVTWWSGELDLGAARVWGVDANGDGRGDICVQEDLGAGGLRFATAISATGTSSLGTLKTRLDAPDLRARTTRTAAGDINRDGRDDLWIAYAAGDTTASTTIDALLTTNFTFARSTFWQSTAAEPLPIVKVKMAATDVNFDGMSDLVLYRDQGPDGTTLITLRTGYTGLSELGTLDDPTLNWSAAQPY
jgi:hypothetical protein